MDLDQELLNRGIKVWDLSTNPGWDALILELADKLIAAGWDKDAHQIKQKFGGLRFYIGDGTPEIRKLIEEYENKSFRVCETCGDTGKRTRSGYWITTLCEKHAKELDC